MKELKNKKETTYEITEKELLKIIKETYFLSTENLKEYIYFCYKNYILSTKTSQGLDDFAKDVIKYCLNYHSEISNNYQFDYYDFLNEKDFPCPFNSKEIQNLLSEWKIKKEKE